MGHGVHIEEWKQEARSTRRTQKKNHGPLHPKFLTYLLSVTQHWNAGSCVISLHSTNPPHINMCCTHTSLLELELASLSDPFPRLALESAVEFGFVDGSSVPRIFSIVRRKPLILSSHFFPGSCPQSSTNNSTSRRKCPRSRSRRRDRCGSSDSLVRARYHATSVDETPRVAITMFA